MRAGSPSPWPRSEDIPEAFAWADLLARLGETRRAVEAYARLDTAPYEVRVGDWNWGLLIRSWLERGELYERLGDRPRAVEMYRRVADAWGQGDEYVQPAVQRARAGLVRLGAGAQ